MALTLREEYNDLERKIDDKYRELINIKEVYDFTIEERENLDDEGKDLLDEGNYQELSFNYDFEASLEQIFYNNRNGEEKMAYLLSVNKVGGIYVLNNESFNPFFISFDDLNGTLAKINVVEKMQDY